MGLNRCSPGRTTGQRDASRRQRVNRRRRTALRIAGNGRHEAQIRTGHQVRQQGRTGRGSGRYIPELTSHHGFRKRIQVRISPRRCDLRKQASSLGFGNTWRGQPADLLLVADLLGHSSLGTLKIYIQPNSIGPNPHAQIRETRSLQSIFESRPKPRSTSGPPGR